MKKFEKEIVGVGWNINEISGIFIYQIIFMIQGRDRMNIKRLLYYIFISIVFNIFLVEVIKLDTYFKTRVIYEYKIYYLTTLRVVYSTLIGFIFLYTLKIDIRNEFRLEKILGLILPTALILLSYCFLWTNLSKFIPTYLRFIDKDYFTYNGAFFGLLLLDIIYPKRPKST